MTTIIIIGSMTALLFLSIRHEKRKNDKRNQQPPQPRQYDPKEIHFTRAVNATEFKAWHDNIKSERQKILSQLSHDKPERTKK